MNSSTDFKALNLLPGTKLHLSSEQYTILKGPSLFIGFHKKRSIIISTPIQKGAPIPCKAGTELIVRLFINHLNCACAFRTTIDHVLAVPYPYLFLAIPEKMEIGEVRDSVRAKVKLTCSVNRGSNVQSTGLLNRKTQSALINNISTDGARVVSKNFLADIGESIHVFTKIKLLGKTHIIQFDCTIRSEADGEGEFIYGVQFNDMDDNTKLLTYAYVMSVLSNTENLS